jgi:CBS domain-containing protein
MFKFVNYLVADFMTAPAVTVTRDATLADVQRVLERMGINGCPVADDGGTLLGLVTGFDILKAFRFEPGAMVPHYDHIMATAVTEVMSEPVATVSSDLPLTRVLQDMLKLGNTGFPVVDGGRLVGMITRQDLMRGLRQAVSPAGQEHDDDSSFQ